MCCCFVVGPAYSLQRLGLHVSMLLGYCDVIREGVGFLFGLCPQRSPWSHTLVALVCTVYPTGVVHWGIFEMVSGMVTMLEDVKQGRIHGD